MKQKPGPKPTGRRRVVRYLTPEETMAIDVLVDFLRVYLGRKVVAQEHGGILAFSTESDHPLHGPVVRLVPDDDGFLKPIREER